VAELLAWIHAPNTNQGLKGFKLLTLNGSDGVSFLPLDFTLCSSTKASKWLQCIKKELDKRCNGYKKRAEAFVKFTDHLKTMAKRVGVMGTRSDSLLRDSWFSFHRSSLPWQALAGDLHGQGHVQSFLSSPRTAPQKSLSASLLQ